MAELPPPRLVFDKGCPDCGRREADLPPPLPPVGDDFDWQARDYDRLRLFMLEELAARFPERRRWTPADPEVVLVEALAVALDQLFDMGDRIAAESTLETARRPETVYRLLTLIGFDPVKAAGLSSRENLLDLWRSEPSRMETARQAGPREIHTQRRMATLADYAERLEEHPLVLRAHAWTEWGGAWPVVHVGLILWNDESLDNTPDHTVSFPEDIKAKVEAFHLTHGLRKPDWDRDPSIRTILRIYLEAWRMVGQEVFLEDADFVGIVLALSIQVRETFFVSEVRRAVEEALGRGPGGFFEPGRLHFGEDLYASDIFQTLMRLDGVENVCLNQFKKAGRPLEDYTAQGFIPLDGLELAVCHNDPDRPERGYYTVRFHGGRKG